MKITLLLTAVLALVLPLCAADNTIYLQHDQIIVHPASTWIIIAHKLDGSKDVVAFQIKNPADEGTQDSANLGVTVYDLRQTENMLEFTGQLLGHEKQKHASSELGEWSINTYSNKQGDTTYEIRDCYRTLGGYGLSVRLAFPKLDKTTKDWTDRLEAQFKALLQSVEAKPAK